MERDTRRLNGRWVLWPETVVVAVLLAAALVFELTPLPTHHDPLTRVRADAVAAVRSLRANDLTGLDKRLAAHRGQSDFAYFFSSESTPRELGDALASVAGSGGKSRLGASVDAKAYDLELTDIAGTLALATHGTGDRALPTSWTEDFIEATTTPEALYRDAHDSSDATSKARTDQDLANKQNLLLLLSRGYWSTGFLEAVTKAYWDFDRAKGAHAWPGATLDDAKYAPAPSGAYLTDGVLALAAALTANPLASAWAFTSFQPGTEAVDGTDYAVGTFTHYLFFEHRYPSGGDEDGDSLGMTATLTALSSAIDATGATESEDASDGRGPMADARVLRSLAKGSADRGGSLLSKAWHVTKKAWDVAEHAAERAWHWVRRWGHLALTILSFTPPPFGATAAGANAVWYTIDGDYADAGLSLAAAVPGLAFVRIARAAEAGRGVEKVAPEAVDVARVAKQIRAGADGADQADAAAAGDVTAYRVWLRSDTRAQIEAQAPRDAHGRPIDPNTHEPILGEPHIGHKPGYEWRCIKAMARARSLTREQLIEYANDPAHYQLEDPVSNQSHRYEAKVCAA